MGGGGGGKPIFSVLASTHILLLFYSDNMTERSN